jgi:hypothetical protein
MRLKNRILILERLQNIEWRALGTLALLVHICMYVNVYIYIYIYIYIMCCFILYVFFILCVLHACVVQLLRPRLLPGPTAQLRLTWLL